MACGIFFSCFVSGEQQEWNNIKNESDGIEGNSNEAVEMDTDTDNGQDRTENIVCPLK